ncbi:MAG TPA: glycoside hydrolase family 38 C-terminal domain-containing protein [Pyrinomonadaceae bacterium]|nr:glycoside hydrolase family 38 C-terminal domain-containing protein [Pyrinomonadaceae bacterium]
MRRYAVSGMLLLLLLCATASSQERTVFKIGAFDNSSEEFAPAASAPVVYTVATGRPQNWVGVQQAVVPGKAGAAEAARKIQFELQSAPQGTYRLRLGLIIKTARAPVVQLDVNGHRGWFHQPLETYREGNSEGAILPQYSIGALNIDVPTSFLRAGRNEFALTAVTDELSTAMPGGETTDYAVLTYDALELSNTQGTVATAIAPGVTGARATPTVFYRREGGRLSEVVSVLVSWRELSPLEGTVTLSLPGNGWTRTQTLAAPGRDFGEQRLEFTVPEFAAGTNFKVAVRANGHVYDVAQMLTPARKWTVYMVPHEHLDVGYSDFQTKLAELHSRIINEALDMNAEHPEFRFTLDGYWQARHFLEGRSEAERQKFYRAVREKKIIVPAQHSVILTGFPTGEALIRSFYGARRLNREAGGPWDTVNITDVPSYSWSYASILAASGLKYFAAAANADRGPTLMLGDLHRRSPFWWEGPDGARVLMWYSRHYHQIGSQFGLPTHVANGYEGLPGFLGVYERPDYPARTVMLHGSQWENTSLYPQQAALVKQWNSLFAYPELRFSGFGEAMQKISAEAEQAGGKLPVVRGDGGPYWEDGIASDAYHAAMERETERRAVSAEKLGVIASLVDPRYRPSRSALDCMWENIALMDEHTWGWGRSITEPHSEDSTRELATKRQYGVAARGCTEYLLERGMTAIAGRINTSPRVLVVFNTLNWPRDGWVEFDLQKTRELFDLETRQVVAFDVLEDHPAYQRIRFMARGVPAVGYKSYDVRDKAAPSTAGRTDGAATAAATQARTDVIENQFYRVTLDPKSGGVRSIYDKALGRELVDQSAAYRFNQYVYVTGGDNPPFTQLLTYRRHLPFAQLEPHAATGGRVVSVTKTPVGVSARLESRGVNTPRIATEIILFDNEKRIEIVNRVSKETIYKKEAAYFAFPLALRSPEFKYEVQNGVVRPARDMMPGAGLEWFSAQNWVSAGDAGAEVGLVSTDSFLWTFGDIVRGTWPTEFKPKGSTVFSYVMNNYWGTNYIAAQGGDFTFRYALTSAPKLDTAAMSRTGWEQTTPLERTLVKSQDKAAPTQNPLPASRMSFLETSNPSVLLSAWKQAEEGEGSVLRFIELGGATAQVRVSSPLFGSFSRRACNAVEDCAQAGAGGTGGFNFETAPRQILTFKLTPSQATKHAGARAR